MTLELVAVGYDRLKLFLQ